MTATEKQHRKTMARWLDEERQSGADNSRLEAIRAMIEGGEDNMMSGTVGADGALDAAAQRCGRLTDWIPTVDEEVADLRRGMIESAIRHLPARDRRLLDLRHRMGLTQVEAAEQLGVCQPSVSKAEARARHRLRYFVMWGLVRRRIDPALRLIDVPDETRLTVSRYLAGATVAGCSSRRSSTNWTRIDRVRELAGAGGQRTAILMRLIDARRAMDLRLSTTMPSMESVLPRRELFALAG